VRRPPRPRPARGRGGVAPRGGGARVSRFELAASHGQGRCGRGAAAGRAQLLSQQTARLLVLVGTRPSGRGGSSCTAASSRLHPNRQCWSITPCCLPLPAATTAAGAQTIAACYCRPRGRRHTGGCSCRQSVKLQQGGTGHSPPPPSSPTAPARSMPSWTCSGCAAGRGWTKNTKLAGASSCCHAGGSSCCHAATARLRRPMGTRAKCLAGAAVLIRTR
jgi:hypothetical protein